MKKILSKITSFFTNMQKGHRKWLIILTSFIIIVILVVSLVLSQKSYAVLYTQMDPAEAGEVLGVLADMNIDAKAEGDDTIYVDEDQVDNARMQLAAKGYPNTGISYDIFQNAAGLGVTDMEKQVYYQFQMQENLRQTIRKFDKVEDAVVNINLKKESSFVLSEDEQPATAAVMLTLANNAVLDTQEVRAIAELVSKSISGLKVEDVRITDSHMNLYSIQNDTETENMDTQMDLQQTVQNRLQQQVTNLLTPVFGEGNVLAEVYVSLNFDQVVKEMVEFKPPENGSEGIVVSMKEIVEVIKNDETGNTASGVDANGGASSYMSANDLEDAVYYNTTKEANYEISQTKTMIENARGQIEDLSVSIIINSAETWNDYTENVIDLVANAVGVDSEMITVEMLPFKNMEQTASQVDPLVYQQQMLNDVQDASMLRLVVIIGGALIVLILLFSIIGMFRKKEVYEEEVLETGGIDVLVGEEIVPDPVSAAADGEEVKDVNFSKDTNVSFLEEYIDKNPESVANLLRNWLNEE